MRIPATSAGAISALNLLTKAQHYFVQQLSELCEQQQQNSQFSTQQWLRDNGQHGGGIRYEAPQHSLFNQASVNVSQIQYEDRPDKAFISATALSTIIHPHNPLAPSVHIHVSWTERRNGESYWRLMADLNPAIANEQDKQQFDATLAAVSGEYYSQASEQGDKYFYIPALQCHRGVSHFYLEGFNPAQGNGSEFAERFVNAVIDSYMHIFSAKCLAKLPAPTPAQKAQQVDYHTLYLYQVLTLDKGTTAGLLIHAQNDVGTLGSLPRFINRDLLTQWVNATPTPHDKLVSALLRVLPLETPCEITPTIKARIASTLREHYQHNR